MSKNDPVPLSVGSLFGGDYKFRVPIYQRSYAWGKDEIHTLLEDVRDYQEKKRDYYIGSLVVSGAQSPASPMAPFDVVDGQQRLTTLHLVLSYLRSTDARPKTGSAGDPEHAADILTFEGRERSTRALNALAALGTQAVGVLDASSIREGFEHISTWFGSAAAPDPRQFERFLLNRVKVVFSVLPAGTDLNHYFEVMNSRGEQLEKHEVVKARLLGCLGDAHARLAFSAIWDACSDLTDPAGTKYIQTRFSPASRIALFGESRDRLRPFTDRGHASAARFDSVADAFAPSSSLASTASTGLPEAVPTIANLLSPARSAEDSVKGSKGDEDSTGRYGSIIDFPNFLLHVLRIHQKYEVDSDPSVIPLDDKQLVEQFDARITSEDDAKGFAFVLLRTRFLFDNYVIKTERDRDPRDDDSNWVLYSPHWVKSGGFSPRATFSAQDADDGEPSPEGRHIVMLQSMFQVSFSGRSNKDFLFRILDYLYAQEEGVQGTAFRAHLQHLARDRYRNAVGEEDSAIDAGTRVPHFAFNYLDYLLWLANVEGRWDEVSSGQDLVDAGKYRFRYRHSIEHFFPVAAQEPLATEEYNDFGNLCLLTPSENSERSNLEPVSKVAQYRKTLDNQTLKFRLMAAITDDRRRWGLDEIQDHGMLMRGLLDESLAA